MRLQGQNQFCSPFDGQQNIIAVMLLGTQIIGGFQNRCRLGMLKQWQKFCNVALNANIDKHVGDLVGQQF